MHTRVIVLMVSLLGGGPTITVAGQPRSQGESPSGQECPLCVSVISLNATRCPHCPSALPAA